MIGAILFAAVAAARKLGVDAESALRRTTRRLRRALRALSGGSPGAGRRSGVDIRGRDPRAVPRQVTSARGGAHARVKTASCQMPRSRERCTGRKPASAIVRSTTSRSWTNARKPRNFRSRRRNHRLEIATEIRLNRPMIRYGPARCRRRPRRSLRACSRGARPPSGSNRGRDSAPRRRAARAARRRRRRRRTRSGRGGRARSRGCAPARSRRRRGRSRWRAPRPLERCEREVTGAAADVEDGPLREALAIEGFHDPAGDRGADPRLRARDALWTAHSSKQHGRVARPGHTLSLVLPRPAANDPRVT